MADTRLILPSLGGGGKGDSRSGHGRGKGQGHLVLMDPFRSGGIILGQVDLMAAHLMQPAQVAGADHLVFDELRSFVGPGDDAGHVVQDVTAYRHFNGRGHQFRVWEIGFVLPTRSFLLIGGLALAGLANSTVYGRVTLLAQGAQDHHPAGAFAQIGALDVHFPRTRAGTGPPPGSGP